MKVTRVKKVLISLLVLGAILLSLPFGVFAGTLPFTDVPQNEWFHPHVLFVYQNGIMHGVGGGRFAPGTNLNRAQFVTILHRLAGSPSASFSPVFSDVANGQFYTTPIMWASQNNIVNGVGGGRFAPNDNLSREQLAVMLHRFAEHQGYNTNVPANFNLNQFNDHAQISTWAITAMRWANYNELITGVTNTTIMPGTAATRAQGAAVIHRFATMVS